MRRFLVSAFLLPAALSAQTLTDQYIELTVSDTLALVPKTYVYELNVADDAPEGNDGENTDWDKVQREQAERQAKELARLEKEVTGMGFTVVRYTGEDDPFSLQPEMEGSPASLRVTLSDKAELKRLVDGLRGRKNVTGNVMRVEFDQSRDLQQDLMTRMFHKAEDRSRNLATLGGRKLGKLLLVSTADDEEFTFSDFMRMMEKERDRSERMQQYGANMPQRMTFRFALID